MRISVITTTCDRQRGVELCEKYMARQTVKPDEWIVADSGAAPATLTMGQIHIHKTEPPGARNLGNNVLRALDAVTGDIVIFVEDDDYYLSNHIEECVKGLRDKLVHGCPDLRYYNVKHRCFIEMKNRGSALCQTAFHASLIPEMCAAAISAREANRFDIDGRFWLHRREQSIGPTTVIGIKGVQGTAGLGMGHRPNSSTRRQWTPDPNYNKLREWIGADAEAYYCADH